MSETTHALLLAGELRRAGLFFEHVENEGRRSAKRGALGKRMGRTKGSFDYRIYTPPPARPEARCVALELKDEGGKLSAEQRAWQMRFEATGGLAQACVGVDGALRWLRSLGYPV